MKYLESLKKEPRLVLSVVNVILFLLPWISYQSTVAFFGFEEELETISFTGFKLVGNSFFMILVLLIPILFIAMNFIPNLKNYSKIIYLGGSLLAVLLIIIVSFMKTRGAVVGADEELLMKVSINRRLGFWVALLAHMGIIVSTLIIDFKMSKNTIKEKGIKGAVTGIVTEVTSEISRNNKVKMVECPSCSAKAPENAKFCPKCGTNIYTTETE